MSFSLNTFLSSSSETVIITPYMYIYNNQL